MNTKILSLAEAAKYTESNPHHFKKLQALATKAIQANPIWRDKVDPAKVVLNIRARHTLTEANDSLGTVCVISFILAALLLYHALPFDKFSFPTYGKVIVSVVISLIFHVTLNLIFEQKTVGIFYGNETPDNASTIERDVYTAYLPAFTIIQEIGDAIGEDPQHMEEKVRTYINGLYHYLNGTNPSSQQKKTTRDHIYALVVISNRAKIFSNPEELEDSDLEEEIIESVYNSKPQST